MEESRPNPDQLLTRVTDEERAKKRGKLKIYLGAAPGVGKTHEMLHDALDERMKGIDVVVGIAESHGRKEIEKLIKYLDVLPRLEVDYHGTKLLEFDLQAALKIHPSLILIDEMAHTNAPDLRHKKRWQDIKELLDRGIDVYTTLNVQHIESLNDDVSQIINAPVKETVPDFMIEMADTIELVDIPPEELIERLLAGKVYVPEQAKLAAELFFRKGNLIALRELALRTAAKRVGEQVLFYRQGHGIKHIWPSTEKILVCVGPGSESLKLIRSAKRIATGLQADWIAVYVETPKIQSSAHDRNQAIESLRFAEQLGAETRILNGFDIVKEILNFSHEQNITLIMIWKHIRKRWKNLFRRSLADEIVRYSGEIDVYTMTGVIQKKLEKQPDEKRAIPWRIYILSIGIVAIATGINFFLFPYLSISNLIMVYLLATTVIALFGSTGPSILGTILSVLVYDYFFVPPFYSFAIADVQYIFTLIVMLLVSMIISQLTLLTRRQVEAARLNENQISALYKLSRQLSGTRGTVNLLMSGVNYLAKTFDGEIIALLPIDHSLAIVASNPLNQVLTQKEQGIAEWVFEMGQKAGLGTSSLSFSSALYIPLNGSQKVLGVLRICPRHKDSLIIPEKIQFLETCANQIGVALEVDRLQEFNLDK